MPHIDPISLLGSLVAIDSINPDLVPGGAGEVEIADFCASWLTDHGFEVHRVGRHPNRPCVVGIVRGTGGGRSLMLNGHLDTVGVGDFHAGEAHEDAFTLRTRDGTPAGADALHARGAFDTKGGVAAIMVAAAAARQQRLAGDVLITLVADEEFGSIGTQDVLESFTADAAIVTEPTQLQVVLSHRGFAWFEIVLTGVAAHGSMPEQGVDAIAHAGLVMRALDDLRERIRSREAHPVLGHGSVRVSMIHGGHDAATVASDCRLTIERRTLPGETPDSVEDELRELLEALAAETPDFVFSLKRLVARAALDEDPTSSIARIVMSQAGEVLGLSAKTRGEPFWTDAGLIAEAGIPCLLIGVDGGGAHAVDEWVSRRSVLQLTDILSRVIAEYCGPVFPLDEPLANSRSGDIRMTDVA